MADKIPPPPAVPVAIFNEYLQLDSDPDVQAVRTSLQYLPYNDGHANNLSLDDLQRGLAAARNDSEQRALTHIRDDFFPADHPEETKLNLGMLYNHLGQYPRAALLLQEALAAVAPGNKAAVYLELGYAYNQGGQFDLALSVYREAAQFFPDNGTIQYHFGIVLYAQDQFAEAVAYFSRAENLGVETSEFMGYKTKAEVDLQWQQMNETPPPSPTPEEMRQYLATLARNGVFFVYNDPSANFGGLEREGKWLPLVVDGAAQSHRFQCYEGEVPLGTPIQSRYSVSEHYGRIDPEWQPDGKVSKNELHVALSRIFCTLEACDSTEPNEAPRERDECFSAGQFQRMRRPGAAPAPANTFEEQRALWRILAEGVLLKARMDGPVAYTNENVGRMGMLGGVLLFRDLQDDADGKYVEEITNVATKLTARLQNLQQGKTRELLHDVSVGVMGGTFGMTLAIIGVQGLFMLAVPEAAGILIAIGFIGGSATGGLTWLGLSANDDEQAKLEESIRQTKEAMDSLPLRTFHH